MAAGPKDQEMKELARLAEEMNDSSRGEGPKETVGQSMVSELGQQGADPTVEVHPDCIVESASLAGHLVFGWMKDQTPPLIDLVGALGGRPDQLFDPNHVADPGTDISFELGHQVEGDLCKTHVGQQTCNSG